MSEIKSTALNSISTDDEPCERSKTKKRLDNRQSFLLAESLRVQLSTSRQNCILVATFSIIFSILGTFASFFVLENRRLVAMRLMPFLNESWTTDQLACTEIIRIASVLVFSYSMISFLSAVLLLSSALKIVPNHKAVLPFLYITLIHYVVVIFILLFANPFMAANDVNGFCVNFILVSLFSLKFQALFGVGHNLYIVMKKMSKEEDNVDQNNGSDKGTVNEIISPVRSGVKNPKKFKAAKSKVGAKTQSVQNKNPLKTSTENRKAKKAVKLVTKTAASSTEKEGRESEA